MTKPFESADQAHIIEIFSSIQGEGVRLGERQVFVRFGGCNLHCDYCDEPDSIPVPSGAVWTLDKIQKEVLRLNKPRQHRSISWTGGEPLLHKKSLKPLMEWSRSQGFENYLETNGTHPAALREIVHLCDVISMDLKLASATGRNTLSSHLEFLRIAPEKTFVKVVVTSGSTDSEWRQVIRLMQEAGPQIPVIIQPATEIAQVKSIEPARAVSYLRQARGLLKEVRLIPQWHPVWSVP